MSNPEEEAISLAREGKFIDAKNKLQLPDKVLSDFNFEAAIRNLDEGLSLAKNGKIIDSLDYLSNVYPIIEESGNDNLILRISLLVDYGAGILYLQRGMPRESIELLENVLEKFRFLSFYDDNFIKEKLNVESALGVADTLASIQSGESKRVIDQKIGDTLNDIDNLREHLDPTDDSDASYWITVKTVPIEFSIYRSIRSISSMDPKEAYRRIEEEIDSRNDLEDYLPKINHNQLEYVSKSNIFLFDAIGKISKSTYRYLDNSKDMSSEDVDNLSEAMDLLNKSKEFANRSGERGVSNIRVCNDMKAFTENILEYSKQGYLEYSKKSGFYSFVSFLILLLILVFLTDLSGYPLIYAIGAIFIISLATGFGIGAVKFIPLIHSYSNAFSANE